MFLPGVFHGQGSLAAYSPWGCKESNTTEQNKEHVGQTVQLLSRVRLFAITWTIALQAPLSLGFSKLEYWSGLPCPPPGNLPNPGIEPRSPTLQVDSLLSEPQGNNNLFLGYKDYLIIHTKQHLECVKRVINVIVLR